MHWTGLPARLEHQSATRPLTTLLKAASRTEKTKAAITAAPWWRTASRALTGDRLWARDVDVQDAEVAVTPRAG